MMGPRPRQLLPLLYHLTIRPAGLRAVLLCRGTPLSPTPRVGLMHVTTRQGTSLILHLAAIPRLPAGQPDPIVEFRYKGGILCSTYWLATFQAIPAGQGLCLHGGTFERQDLDPDAVAACQAQCAAWMSEVLA